jgi:hypothetical protein
MFFNASDIGRVLVSASPKKPLLTTNARAKFVKSGILKPIRLWADKASK